MSSIIINKDGSAWIVKGSTYDSAKMELEGEFYVRMWTPSEYNGPPIYQWKDFSWFKEVKQLGYDIILRIQKILREQPHPLLSRKANYLKDTRFILKDLTDRKAVGIADYDDNSISVCEVFFSSQTNRDKELEDTIIHEICHICCPGKGHNETWQYLFNALGGTGKKFCSA